ncbi:cysteine dioxygenase family protein [Streptomyces coacervatus]|uniref:Cysteine dioxygenase family protein n=1 Tax=Streptomyces coacervatus TaxID=647381 RepID=A0ABP7JDJ2_9ACTN|nr:cysteine dioxygenase family protein [Streptomyces coacervatus]MDF2273410.1 cysteine dioxygenase family protein [Streptomyces coacervatus]
MSPSVAVLTAPGSQGAPVREGAVAHPDRTARLGRLIDEIRAALGARREVTPEQAGERVAAVLAPHLGRADLLTPSQQAADAHAYRQHILHAEPGGSFSVVALVWLPGQCTPIHDHVAWAVSGIHQGAERETVYRLVRDAKEPYLVATGTSTNGVGAVSFLAPPGDIHDVRCAAPGRTVSLHVYGADIARLGSSVRRKYTLPVLPCHSSDRSDPTPEDFNASCH